MILQAKHLTKRYGNYTAVDDIQLQFEKGSFNAILGPNSAGKSTTISMLIGLKKPTKGQIRYTPNTKIEVVFQASVLDDMLTVRENLTSSCPPCLAGSWELGQYDCFTFLPKCQQGI
ncbi:putative ABC transporter, ATP-binding protein [Streptococcus sp. HSISS2]|nr:putative ABC transporter, ATP-binding protein [Streptococcus sp. HSISS2]